jgi:hypothetical protein
MERSLKESKQGESLVLENKPENTKKLFIELRLRDELFDSVSLHLSNGGLIQLKF